MGALEDIMNMRATGEKLPDGTDWLAVLFTESPMTIAEDVDRMITEVDEATSVYVVFRQKKKSK